MPNITDLPEEILQKIFLFLGFDRGGWNPFDLNLTLVCKKFNRAIGSSTKLMETMQVNWEGNKLKDTNVLLASQRKFRNVAITKTSVADHALQKFLTKHSLTMLSLYKCAFMTSDLALLLDITGENLQHIDMIGTSFILDCDIQPMKFPKLDDITIMYSRNGSLMSKFFQGTKNVRHVSYESDKIVNGGAARTLGESIASFENLKSLLIIANLAQQLFGDDCFTKNAKFQLTSLSVCMNFDSRFRHSIATEQHYENFGNFIVGQQKFLGDLRLNRFHVTTNLINSVLCLDNLEYVNFVNCHFQMTGNSPVQKNASIDKVLIKMEHYFGLFEESEAAIGLVLKNCLNLRSLELNNMVISFEISLIMQNKMKNLKKLKLDACIINHPMKYPTVESMKIENITDFDTVIKIIRMNCQLKHLKLPPSIQYHPKYLLAMSELENI